MKVCELNNELLKVYGDWLNELRQINDGKFLSDSYSNPYFIAAPESWLNSKLKYGRWQRGSGRRLRKGGVV